MKTPIIFLTILSLLVNQLVLNAQDIIFTNTGSVYEGKVVEVNENFVKYKKKENPDGPVYSIEKTKITKIKYNNNKEEIFTTSSDFSAENNNEKTLEELKFDSIITKKKNIVGYDVAQFVYVSVGLSYERFFGKNAHFSIRIPMSIGFKYIGNEDRLIIYDNSDNPYSFSQNDNYYIYQNGKLAGGAIEFNYYPLKSKKFTYFVGPYFEYGVFAYKIQKSIRVLRSYNSYTGEPFYDYITQISPLRYDGQHLAAGINNGFLLHFNEIFTLTGTFGIGLKKDETPIPKDKVLTQAKFNFIFGIKF